jgi:hypothetical protein
VTITTKSPILLLDVAQDSAVPAELWDAITDSQLADWEGEWLPGSSRRYSVFARPGSIDGSGLARRGHDGDDRARQASRR